MATERWGDSPALTEEGALVASVVMRAGGR
jgi:hypothetical protein